MKNKILFSLIIALIIFFNSCNQTQFDPISPDKLMGDSLVANYTIGQLIDSFITNVDSFTDIKYGGTNSGLFTSDIISSQGDVVIKGVVTSFDTEGNIYKYVTIQEENGDAIKISIEASGVSSILPLGQRVWVRCNGLYLGKYAQSPQLGDLEYNHDKSVLFTTIKYDSVKMKNDTIINTIYRKEPGRIKKPIAMRAIHTYGLPDTTLIIPDTMTIAQIKAAGSSVINKLVCIKNAFFTGKGADRNLPVPIAASDMIFAPSTNGIGFPQSREIQDGTGSIFVSTSEYAKFARVKLPESSNRGNITAIVSWYNDKKPTVNPSVQTAEIYHQLTIRSLKDLGKGFEQFHAEVQQ